MPVNFAYLMQPLRCTLEPMHDEVPDSFTALMPEPLYLELIRKYLVRHHYETRTLDYQMVRAMADWVEQDFDARLVAPVKSAMGEVPTSVTQRTHHGTSSASTASTAKRSRH